MHITSGWAPIRAGDCRGVPLPCPASVFGSGGWSKRRQPAAVALPSYYLPGVPGESLPAATGASAGFS
ncbi:MAG: hypothetical protein WBM40_24170, partial [Thiohalocapsa sp.]